MRCLNWLVLRQRQQGLLLLRQATTSAGGASGALLQNPELLTSASQLGQAELESLAFILGTKDEFYQSFARQGHDQIIVAGLLGGLDANVKQVLIQKLVAVSGVQATPVLLSWSAEEIRKALSVALTAPITPNHTPNQPSSGSNLSAAGTATSGTPHLQPWYPGLLSLATQWAACRPPTNPTASTTPASASLAALLTEQDCLQGLLATPGALRWADLLALPGLPQLLTQAAEGNQLLTSMLTHLGLQFESTVGTPSTVVASTASPAAAAAVDPASSAAAAAAAVNPAGPAPVSSSPDSVPTATLDDGSSTLDKSQVPSADVQGFAASAGALELQAKQYLMKQLALDPSASPPITLISQITQRDAVRADMAVPVLVMRLIRHVRAALGQAPEDKGAAITLRLLHCWPQEPQQSIDAGLVQDAARELLAHSSSQGISLGQVEGMSEDGLAVLMRQAAAAKPAGALAQLMGTVQAHRQSCLLQGQPWALASATTADIESLTPDQFWPLYKRAQTQAAAGKQLARQVFDSNGSSSLLRTLWALPEEDRSALAWVLLRGDSGTASTGAGRAAKALLQAFAGQAGAAAAAAGASAQAAAELAEVIAVERQMAELDYLGDRDAAPLELPPPEAWQAGSPTAPLPPAKDLQRARNALPESQLLLFDLLQQDLTKQGAQVSEQQLAAAFDSLFTATSSATPAPQLLDPSDPAPPASLPTWVSDAKRQLVGLSPTALTLLSRFLELRVARDKEAVQRARAGLRELLGEVQALVARTTGSPPRSKSMPLSPYWVSPDSTRQSRSQAPGSESRAQEGLPSPEAVSALLGPIEGQQFEAWLKASALNAEEQVQPYQLLDNVHREQDLQRYLTMEHDPQLHVVWEAAPRPWTEATPATPPDQFLQDMKPALDRYLSARGMRPLLDAEWMVYRDAALSEFAEQRAEHEAALRSQGHSAFFNSRAEAVYLRGLLTAGIPPGAPLAAQAARYLKVLEANSTWTFMQKKRAVLRLVELSAHFAAQPPPSERGSPFAPLFAPGSTVPLVPALKPWRELRREARASS